MRKGVITRRGKGEKLDYLGQDVRSRKPEGEIS